MSKQTANSKVVIRPMTQQDYDMVAKMDKATQGGDRYVSFPQPITLDTLVQQKAFGFVAHDSDRMVGFVIGIVRQNGDDQSSAWLYMTGVHQDYRHQGIGNRLAEAFFKYCSEHGMKSIRVNVAWGDASMLTWLGSLGFGVSLGKMVEFEKIL